MKDSGMTIKGVALEFLLLTTEIIMKDNSMKECLMEWELCIIKKILLRRMGSTLMIRSLMNSCYIKWLAVEDIEMYEFGLNRKQLEEWNNTKQRN